MNVSRNGHMRPAERLGLAVAEGSRYLVVLASTLGLSRVLRRAMTESSGAV